MKVKELKKKLEEYNPEAQVSVVVNNTPLAFSIAFGTSEGCTKENCGDVLFDVRGMNSTEREG